MKRASKHVKVLETRNTDIFKIRKQFLKCQGDITKKTGFKKHTRMIAR